MQIFKKFGTLIFSLFIFSPLTYSQENNKTQEIAIHNLEKGLQQSDYTLFKNSLSVNFITGSYGASMVSQVIPQILMQYASLISLDISASGEH